MYMEMSYREPELKAKMKSRIESRDLKIMVFLEIEYKISMVKTFLMEYRFKRMRKV